MISLRGYLATGSGLFSRLLDRKDLRRETVVVLLLAKLAILRSSWDHCRKFWPSQGCCAPALHFRVFGFLISSSRISTLTVRKQFQSAIIFRLWIRKMRHVLWDSISCLCWLQLLLLVPKLLPATSISTASYPATRCLSLPLPSIKGGCGIGKSVPVGCGIVKCCRKASNRKSSVQVVELPEEGSTERRAKSIKWGEK